MGVDYLYPLLRYIFIKYLSIDFKNCHFSKAERAEGENYPPVFRERDRHAQR